MTPRTKAKRISALTESITYVTFNNVRRGLFERHKLIFAAILCLRILMRDGVVETEEVVHLIQGKILQNAPALPDSVRTYLTEAIWINCKSLESISEFTGLCESLEGDQLQWKKWFGEEKAEECDLPKNFKDITKFHKLMLVKAMRQDRVTSALRTFV